MLAARAVSSRYRERCATGLEKLFDDSDPEIRQEARECSGGCGTVSSAELDGLAHAFLSSAAFEGNHQHFLRALEVSTADVVELILATADRMVASYGEQLGDLQSRIGGGRSQPERPAAARARHARCVTESRSGGRSTSST